MPSYRDITSDVRLCRTTLRDGEVIYDFHIVFFNWRGEPVAWYFEPYTPWGETTDDLMNDLNLLMSALTERAVIDLDILEKRRDLEKAYAKTATQYSRGKHQSW